jgi:hypothetical protein
MDMFNRHDKKYLVFVRAAVFRKGCVYHVTVSRDASFESMLLMQAKKGPISG